MTGGRHAQVTPNLWFDDLAYPSLRKTARAVRVVGAPTSSGTMNRMLLTLETTYKPATDLGYLLHKNPSRVQQFELSAGRAIVFYPKATAELCVAALLVEIDPIALVRGRIGAREGGLLDQYV